MAALTQTLTDAPYTGTAPRARFGGPRRPRSARAARVNEFMGSGSYGSHMPIDTGIHWEWRNPLNIIPAFMLLALIIAVVGTALSLL